MWCVSVTRKSVPQEAANDAYWIEYLKQGLVVANDKATSHAQRIGKYALLPTDLFTEKGGELTPTLKLKRSVTADKYKDLIETIMPHR